MIDAVLEGQGAINGPIPAALSEWALPIDELGEGAKYYRHDPAEAKRLLAAAGHPNGFSASVCFSTYGSTVLVDQMQLLLKDLKAVGIDAKLDQKEYGAYQATCRVGKFDSMSEPELDVIETPSPVNPIGAKGCGETGAIGAPPAVVNAVLDALAPLGVTDLDMPLTSTRVWSAIQAARHGRR